MKFISSRFDNIYYPIARGLRNYSYLTIGNILSQLIGLAGMIVIARLFGPERYGIYATVIAFVTFFDLFTINGLSKIIVREAIKKGDSLRELLESTIGFKLVMILVAICICNFSAVFTNYDNYTKSLIMLFSAEIFHFGMDSYLKSIYQTHEKMQYIAQLNFATRFCITLFSIVGLYLGGSVTVILLLNLFAKYLILFTSYFLSRKFVRFKINLDLTKAVSLIRPIILFTVIQFMNVLAIKIDIVMISLMSGPKDAGIYNIANEVAKEGLILCNLFSMAFLPVAVKWIIDNKIDLKMVFKISTYLFVTILFVCIIASFFVENVVTIVFGEEYIESGKLLKLILFYLPFVFFTLPLTTLLQASGNESALVIVVTIGAFLNIPLNIILFNIYGLIGIALSTLTVFSIRAVIVSYLSIQRLKE